MFALNVETNTGRILSATFPQYAPPEAPIVESLPDGNIADYCYQNNEYIFEPLPEPETADGQTHGLEQRVTDCEADIDQIVTELEGII